jgi:deoxyribonuclease-4
MSPKQTTTRKSDKQLPLLGAHFSIAGGLHKALHRASQYNCSALQIFTKNAITWKERSLSIHDVEQFNVARRRCPEVRFICSHAAYLINLASPDPKTHARSVKALKHELLRSSLLGIPYVVLHPGAHRGMGENRGLHRIAESINATFDHSTDSACALLLETTAGQGSQLGHTFEQLALIADRVEATERVGFCFDTCHVFAAGYDLRTKGAFTKTVQAFHEAIGLERLRVIHLNDAKKGLGSKVDRHEHIGKGKIGLSAFRFIMNHPRLKTIPKILETPKENGAVDCDLLNLNRLQALISS